MNILIIGGTRFQGKYLVKELLAAGHTVTVFHLGGNAINPHNRLNDIIGNRNECADLAKLAGQIFDVCIDTCAYFPKQVSLVTKNLIIERYCLISSVFAYDDKDAILCEQSSLYRNSDNIPTRLTKENYGALKVMCEDTALMGLVGKCLIIRPSIIIGPGDHTERLLFWMRLASIHGKRINICNLNPILQLVDVRDLAWFLVKCIEKGRHGVVNVCGEPIRLSAVLDLVALIAERRLETKTLLSEDIQGIGIDRLPFYDNLRIARYSTVLSKAWGFAGRDLRHSLTDIHTYSKNSGFAMEKFQQEEIAVLSLFS